MSNDEIIAELKAIEAWADELKQRCYKTRKKLECIDIPAPQKGLSEDERLKLVAKRNKHKNAPAVNRGNFLTTIK